MVRSGREVSAEVNVLFLSPHFPPQFWHFCRALKEEGARALGLADAPWHELSGELKGSLADFIHVPRFDRYDDVLRAAALFIHRHGRLGRLDSLNEHWMELEARLREDFNVEGFKPRELKRFRSKTGMREVFGAAGVPCTEGLRVDSLDEARRAIARFGLPVVFKPDVGVGAAGTFKVTSEEQLGRLSARPLQGYVVERFEPGTVTSFDGLTDEDGRIVFSLSHLFSAGVMDIVNERRTMHYYSRRDIPPLLEEYGRRIVRAFDLKARFFHLEFFVQGDGFRALEANLRPPGGFTTDMMNWTCDFDVYRLWAKAVTGQSLDGFTYERKWHVAHVGRRHEVRYRLGHDALVGALGPTLIWSRPMPPVLAGAMGDTVYMLREKSEAKLLEAIELVGAA